MYGIFQVFTMPTLMINDPKMIREVSVKQFSRFTTRLRSRANFLLGPLSENFMTIIEGNAWKRQRSTIKPFFSGKISLNISSQMETSQWGRIIFIIFHKWFLAANVVILETG